MKKYSIIVILLSLILFFSFDKLMADLSMENLFYKVSMSDKQISEVDNQNTTARYLDDNLDDQIIGEVIVYENNDIIKNNNISSYNKNFNLNSTDTVSGLSSEYNIDNINIMIKSDGYMVTLNGQQYFIPLQEIESTDYTLDILSDNKVLEEIESIINGGI